MHMNPLGLYAPTRPITCFPPSTELPRKYCSYWTFTSRTVLSLKMEVLQEINRVRDDRLDLLETLKAQREELLHVLRNTFAITAAVLEEDYLRRTVELYFGLRDNIISVVNSMDVLEENPLREKF